MVHTVLLVALLQFLATILLAQQVLHVLLEFTVHLVLKQLVLHVQQVIIVQETLQFNVQVDIIVL